jgi:hypothetical protein
VHQRIVPFRTYDRLKWADTDSRLEDQENTLAWGRKVGILGWYDYMYGSPYLIPRVYFHQMAEYLKFGYKNKVRALYAEAYPNWGEGPKLYIALKLLWNPDQDVNALLKDWYIAAVGEDAAPFLEAYYAHWEKFWTQRISQTEWFKVPGFVRYYHPGYLDAIDYDEIAESRYFLEKTIDKVKTEAQKNRAALLMKAFEYYEASVYSYLGIIKNKPIEGKPRRYFEMMNEKRLILVNEFQNNPVLLHPIRFDNPPLKGLRWK